MKFKVGDRVKIRKDLIAPENYGSQLFTPSMAVYKGKEAIIKRFNSDGYRINLDRCYWAWTDEMFEPVEMTIPQLQSEIDRLGNEVDKQNGLLVSNKQRLCYLKSELKKLQRKKPILDEKEKEYLSAVIKPFKDDVESVVKEHVSDGEYISFYMNKSTDNFILPNFKKGTMYKGMELDKEYTLKELGL